MRLYSLFGIQVASEIKLPAEMAEASEADVVIRRHDLLAAPSCPTMVHVGVACQWQQQQWSWHLPTIGRIEVAGGDRVDVYAHEHVQDADIACFLMGPALVALLMQRQRIALVGNAIAYDDRHAFALLSASPCGKSSLSYAAQQRDWRCVSDGLVVPPQSASAEVVVGLRWLPLWRDMCLKFDLSLEQLQQVRRGLEQYSVPINDCSQQSYRLTHVFVLQPSRVKPDEVVLQQGLDTFRLLQRYTAGEPWVQGMGQIAAQFHQLTRWGNGVQAMQLVYRKGMGAEVLLDQIESHLSLAVGGVDG